MKYIPFLYPKLPPSHQPTNHSQSDTILPECHSLQDADVQEDNVLYDEELNNDVIENRPLLLRNQDKQPCNEDTERAYSNIELLYKHKNSRTGKDEVYSNPDLYFVSLGTNITYRPHGERMEAVCALFSQSASVKLNNDQYKVPPEGFTGAFKADQDTHFLGIGQNISLKSPSK